MSRYIYISEEYYRSEGVCEVDQAVPPHGQSCIIRELCIGFLFKRQLEINGGMQASWGSSITRMPHVIWQTWVRCAYASARPAELGLPFFLFYVCCWIPTHVHLPSVPLLAPTIHSFHEGAYTWKSSVWFVGTTRTATNTSGCRRRAIVPEVTYCCPQEKLRNT
jgi:hypothetical protein